MDQTQLFRASLMAVKLQRKAAGQSVDIPQQPDKHRILSNGKKGKATKGDGKTATPKPKDEFMQQAREVCQKITTLRNVLLENRAAYMRIGQHLKSSAQMTDAQRDLIDNESEKVIAHYSQQLVQMRADWKHAKRKPQQHRHMEGVLELLDRYLNSVQAIYLEQRKYRIQHELETYRLLKLAPDKRKIPVRPASGKAGLSSKSRRPHRSDDSDGDEAGYGSGSGNISAADEWAWGTDTDEENQQDSYDGKRRHLSTPQKSSRESSTAAYASDSKSSLSAATKSPMVVEEEDDESEEQHNANAGLTPDEIQLYEQENATLYMELQGVAEEVEQIEKNVVDIAHLQDIFTEKVSLQQHNIERIANAVVGATENVKDANEQIMQAIQRNAGLRVWSLFFLLVMSFALLFLDWYYD